MGDEVATIAAETETAETVGTSTVLTDVGTTETGDTETGSEGVADAATNDGTSADEGQEDADAGAEGSQTPPDTYADFTLPEGTVLDEVALTEALGLFKEDGLSQEQSQKYVDLYSKMVQAGSQTQTDNFNQLMSDWRDQSKNDGEFGGDKFDENIKVAQAAVNAYGTSELKQLLEDHGVGNHPEMVRFMVRVGRTLEEDVPGVTGTATSKAADHVSILYPNDS